MGAGAGTDLTFVNVVVMKDSFDTGLRLLSDMARHPAFAPEEIERKRRQTLSALQVNFEDPGFIADAVFDRLVYGFHPYGLPQSGTPESLASITRDDLVAYHRQNFVRQQRHSGHRRRRHRRGSLRRRRRKCSATGSAVRSSIRSSSRRPNRRAAWSW